MTKVPKDYIFVIVLALVLVNLTLWLIRLINVLMVNWLSPLVWALTISTVMAIIGVLWLLRSYKRGRKIAKQNENEKERR